MPSSAASSLFILKVGLLAESKMMGNTHLRKLGEGSTPCGGRNWRYYIYPAVPHLVDSTVYHNARCA